MSKGGPVFVARECAAQVGQGEFHSAAYGGVGPVALAEAVAASIHPKLGGNRTVHHYQGRGDVRGALHRRQVETGQQQRLDGRDYDREILGQTARHDRVGGQLLHGGAPAARRNLTHHLQGRPPRRIHERPHPLGGGWDDGEAVGPAGCVGQGEGFVVPVCFSRGHVRYSANSCRCGVNTRLNAKARSTIQARSPSSSSGLSSIVPGLSDEIR